MLLDKVKHILCISLILLVGVTTLYACKSDDKELQGEPVLQVQKSIGFKERGWGSSRTCQIEPGVECIGN
ncbi:hypothetical protein NXV44_11235 [Bacteroides thetaiotaomicron]|nr:hypothetical protein [Bacteroides thetaiotaomicron]